MISHQVPLPAALEVLMQGTAWQNVVFKGKIGFNGYECVGEAQRCYLRRLKCRTRRTLCPHC